MEGLVTVQKVLLADGKEMPTQRAVELGWIRPCHGDFPGWDMKRDEVCLGKNLFLDEGRQLLCYAFGGKSPLTDFICQRFGLGIGTTPPNATNVTLASPIDFYESSPGVFTSTKPISSIDFPTPFVARVEFVIGAAEANGYLITEMGLFSGNNTIFSRRVHAGINKIADFSPTLSWKIRL